MEQFPFLTPAEFVEALEHFSQVLSKWKGVLSRTYTSRDAANTYQTIIYETTIEPDAKTNDTTPEEETILEEDDDDPEYLAPKRSHAKIALIGYHIVLSPIYCVPVLYFNMTINGTPASLDDIYKYLVQPNEHGREIQSIGMMGAVSQGDHPIEGKPFWFIHPCATASTLEEWRGGDNVGSTYEITLKNYIQIWLGIVGSCVGLHLPVEAVASQQVEKRDIPSKRNHVEQAKEGAIHLTT